MLLFIILGSRINSYLFLNRWCWGGVSEQLVASSLSGAPARLRHKLFAAVRKSGVLVHWQLREKGSRGGGTDEMIEKFMRDGR